MVFDQGRWRPSGSHFISMDSSRQGGSQRSITSKLSSKKKNPFGSASKLKSFKTSKTVDGRDSVRSTRLSTSSKKTRDHKLRHPEAISFRGLKCHTADKITNRSSSKHSLSRMQLEEGSREELSLPPLKHRVLMRSKKEPPRAMVALIGRPPDPTSKKLKTILSSMIDHYQKPVSRQKQGIHSVLNSRLRPRNL